eukprot:TRINITY_DN27542_c0_g1_i1.p1 TRINITY_DN27542_c0_g1~~TRINITY_DN27542_c0_g1_i1.p1  ORF type:complete len:110 (-),score=11.33 TRINITY_DN27542_c0_g1_i1:8-337(-)
MTCSDNILYPKEDETRRILLYACKFCAHQEIAYGNCMYRKEFRPAAARVVEVGSASASETERCLPRNKSVRCALCNYGEAVFLRTPSSNEEMTLSYLCCNPNCGYKWRA